MIVFDSYVSELPSITPSLYGRWTLDSMGKIPSLLVLAEFGKLWPGAKSSPWLA